MEIPAELLPFIPHHQRFAIAEGLKGEESDYFSKKIEELQRIISTMPKTYEQDGKGDQSIAYLHYFYGSCDWLITEKDIEGDGTVQAFGMANLGYGGELGYISIVEIIQSGIPIDLDLHWQPRTLSEIN